MEHLAGYSEVFGGCRTSQGLPDSELYKTRPTFSSLLWLNILYLDVLIFINILSHPKCPHFVIPAVFYSHRRIPPRILPPTGDLVTPSEGFLPPTTKGKAVVIK